MAIKNTVQARPKPIERTVINVRRLFRQMLRQASRAIIIKHSPVPSFRKARSPPAAENPGRRTATGYPAWAGLRLDPDDRAVRGQLSVVRGIQCSLRSLLSADHHHRNICFPSALTLLQWTTDDLHSFTSRSMYGLNRIQPSCQGCRVEGG